MDEIQDFDGAAFQKSLEEAVRTAFKPGELDPLQVNRLTAFGTWLAHASGSVNLTRILDPAGMAVGHFLDTYMLLPLLEQVTGRVLDAGTGGGVPGIPLAIFRPDRPVVLIDGTAKKIRFVREWIEQLDLHNASALHTRAEAHLKTHDYEVVVSRAAVKPAAMMEYLRATGPAAKTLIFMEGSKGKETARKVASLAKWAGYKLESVTAYRLPGFDRDRHLVRFIRSAGGPRRR